MLQWPSLATTQLATTTTTTTTNTTTTTTTTAKIYSAFMKSTVDVSRDKKNIKKAWTQLTVYKLSVRSCPFTKLKNK